MNKRRNVFTVILITKLLFGVLIALIHVINRCVFARCGKKSELNGVWKSEYGKIAFLKKGEGEPILLVHGTGIGAGSGEWHKNIEKFSKTRTVYAIDLPGFGNSEKRRMTYNSYYFAKVINSFIKKVIGQKVDVMAVCGSSGFVLAGSSFEPWIYKSITIINPYGAGMGFEYSENRVIKAILPVPVIGTLVYNCISGKKSVAAYIAKTVPDMESADEMEQMVKNQYRNAHLFGSGNKYTAISLIRGYFETPIFNLMENCPVPLNVVISGNGPVPLLAEREGLTVTEIQAGELCPDLLSNGLERLWS